MAKVRCSCGRQYNVPDDRLGQRVQCGACGKHFTTGGVAEPAAKSPPAPKEPPAPAPARTAAPPREPARPAAKPRAKAPSGRRHHLGELAIARGYVTRAQLDACLEYQKAMAGLPQRDDRRLGEILVHMRLIARTQLESLLGEQTEELADAFAQAAASIPSPRERKHAVSEERLAVIRESVKAAAHAEAEARAGAVPARHRTGAIEQRRFLLNPLYLLLAPAVALVTVLVWWLWPAPRAQRVLAAYLRSCDERAIRPDASLALRDLELVVRDFDGVRCERAVHHDYTAEIQAALGAKKDPAWADVIHAPNVADGKRRLLDALVPALPEGLTPKKMESLEVAVRPVTARVVWRRRGAGSFFEDRLRFLVVQVASPAWSCGWRVAAVERAESEEPRSR